MIINLTLNNSSELRNQTVKSTGKIHRMPSLAIIMAFVHFRTKHLVLQLFKVLHIYMSVLSWMLQYRKISITQALILEMNVKIFMRKLKTNYFNNSQILSIIDGRLLSIHPDWFNCALLKSNSWIRGTTSEPVWYESSSSVVSVYRK